MNEKEVKELEALLGDMSLVEEIHLKEQMEKDRKNSVQCPNCDARFCERVLGPISRCLVCSNPLFGRIIQDY